MSAQIIPAIIPKDFRELEEKITMVKGIVPFVQIDVMDGRYTPEASWPYRKHDSNFEEIQDQTRGLPGWEEVDFEIDLMVKEPENIIDEWITAGASRIIIHLDSTEKLDEIIQKLNGLVEIGVALGITTPLEKIEPYINSINFIQCMGIEKIGFQGQPFDERVLERIKEIKSKYTSMVVSVDGGVNFDTASRLLDAGAERLVAGSAIYKNENYVEAIHTLEQL